MTNSKKKKERRKLRYLRNIRKEVEYKKDAWEKGKLIEENHNNGPYSPEYSIELGNRLYNIMQSFKEQAFNSKELLNSVQKNEFLIIKFRMYRIKIRDFILHYNPIIPKSKEYNYLKLLIETYWDKPNELIYYI